MPCSSAPTCVAKAWSNVAPGGAAVCASGRPAAMSTVAAATIESVSLVICGTRLLRRLDPDAPVFHLTAIAFEADRAGRRHLRFDVQLLAVHGRDRHAVRHRDDHLVPVLRLV